MQFLRSWPDGYVVGQVQLRPREAAGWENWATLLLPVTRKQKSGFGCWVVVFNWGSTKEPVGGDGFCGRMTSFCKGGFFFCQTCHRDGVAELRGRWADGPSPMGRALRPYLQVLLYR